MLRRHYAIDLQQASQEAPVLATLIQQVRDSNARLQAITPLLPPTLRTVVRAGPVEGSTWCLLVRGNAAAAKLRQLLPAFQAHLRTKGWAVEHIRLKIER